MININRNIYKVSIVIPFYSNSDWLEEAIISVYNQTFTDYEVIIINDGSKEDISKILNKYTDIKYFYQKNSGPAVARNFGIEESKGEYIAFLDSDDIWDRDKLEIQVKYMDENPNLIWSHTDYSTFGNGEIHRKNLSGVEGNLYPYCFNSLKVATPCIMIRRKIFIDNRYRFNKNMRYGQDFYLWILLCKDFELGHINESLSSVRLRGKNASTRSYVMLKSKHDIYTYLIKNKNFNKGNIDSYIKISYGMCSVFYKIISRLEKMNIKGNILEIISKILYFLPYSILVINR